MNNIFFENKDGRIVLLFPLYDPVLCAKLTRRCGAARIIACTPIGKCTPSGAGSIKTCCVVALNAASVAKTIDIPVQPLGLDEGALGDAFSAHRRWPIVSGVLREVKLPPQSGLVLV